MRSLSTVIQQRLTSGPSGSVAVLWFQIDQRITGLGQFRDGNSTSLFDELSHRVHFGLSDGDKLAPVVNDPWKKEKKRRDNEQNEFVCTLNTYNKSTVISGL